MIKEVGEEILRLRTFIISFLTALLFCATCAFGLSVQAKANTTAISDGDVSLEQKAKMASIQVPFVPNEGQVNDTRVKFYADTFAGTVFVTGDGITYALHKGDDGGWAVKEKFVRAKAFAPAAASSPGSPVNYYTGKVQKSLSSYKEITLGEVYDRINVNLRAYGNNVEKIFTVNPGGDPSAIALKVAGADKLSVNEQGELELATGLGTVKMTRPVAYQKIDGQMVDVPVAYLLKGDVYGFQVGDYNHAYPLVIDPLLASTFLGGSGDDRIYAIALDAAGNVCVAGYTKSNNFPTVAGGYDQSYNGNYDAFVAKLSGDLKQLFAATYLGGSANEIAYAVTADGSGNVYIAGETNSGDFPVTLMPCQDTTKGDMFVAKLDSVHLRLAAATCFGGSGYDGAAFGIAIDPSENIFVAAQTSSANISVNGYQQSFAGEKDVLVVKFSKDLGQVLVSTYLGGSGIDDLYALAVDQGGRVYVGGTTWSLDYPTTANALSITNRKTLTIGSATGFVSCLNNDLSQLIASTYLGGSTSSYNVVVRAITCDSTGKVYVTGETRDLDFPVTAGAYADSPGSGDAFVTKLDSDLSGPPLASTYIGGTTGGDIPRDIALDDDGNVYVTGMVVSSNYPVTAGAYQPKLNGSNDAFLCKLNGGLTALLASTYLGGTSSESANSLAVNAAGNVYVAGQTKSSDYPVTPNAFQGAYGGGGSYDGFIAKLTGDLALTAAPDTTAPIWPSGNLSVSGVTYSGATLTWSGAMDNMGVTEYQIQIIKNGSVIDSVYGISATTYDITGLNSGTEYTFKVEAGDAAGNWSTDGPSKTVTTAVYDADSSAPTWPNGSTLTASNIADTSLTLTWTPAVDDTLVTGYKIFENNIEIATVSGAVYSYDVTGLAVNNHYTFKVEAGDAAGNWSTDGPSTAVDTTLTSDTIPPFWPAGTTLTHSSAGSTSVLLKWTPAQDNVGVTGYKVYKDGVEIATVNAPTTEYIATGLANRVSYLFKIEAFDGAGNLSSSGPYTYAAAGGLYLAGAYLTGISGGSPASTTGPSIEGNSSVPLNPTFKLNFSNNVVKDHIWIDNQSKVSLQDSSGNNVPIIVTRIPDTVNFDERSNVFVSPLASLKASTQYKLIIAAGFTANNESSLGVNREIDFTTEASATGTPAWPSGGTMTVSNPTPSGVTLAWTPADSGAGVTSYIIIRNNSDIIASVDGAATSCDITGLTSGTTYTFQVQAFNSTNYWSSPGPSVAVTTTVDTAAPAWPTGSSLTASSATSTGLTLSWSAATDDAAVTGYQIYKDGTLYTTVSGDTLTCNVTGLNPGTTYTFKVEAGDAAGRWTTDGPSVTAATTADNTAPVWPAGSALTASNILDTALTLSWSAATDDAAVTGYQIYKDGTLYATVSGSTLTCNVTGLNPGTTYTFKVEAGDAAGHWTTDGPSAGATTAPSGGSAKYTVTPVADTAYTAGETTDGIDTMTAHSSGLINFTVNVSPVTAHPGTEKAVFTHLRNNLQVGLSTAVADFDTVTAAQAAFNVQPGDVVKVYIVDDLNTAVDTNPVVLE